MSDTNNREYRLIHKSRQMSSDANTMLIYSASNNSHMSSDAKETNQMELQTIGSCRLMHLIGKRRLM